MPPTEAMRHLSPHLQRGLPRSLLPPLATAFSVSSSVWQSTQVWSSTCSTSHVRGSRKRKVQGRRRRARWRRQECRSAVADRAVAVGSTAAIAAGSPQPVRTRAARNSSATTTTTPPHDIGTTCFVLAHSVSLSMHSMLDHARLHPIFCISPTVGPPGGMRAVDSRPAPHSWLSGTVWQVVQLGSRS